MTRVVRTLFTAMKVTTELTSASLKDVLVQVVVRPRGGVRITINEGYVDLTLTEGERIALIEALGGTP